MQENLDDSSSLSFLDCLARKEQGGLQGKSPSTHIMKVSFFVHFVVMEKSVCIDNTDSLVDFLSWLGYR